MENSKIINQVPPTEENTEEQTEESTEEEGEEDSENVLDASILREDITQMKTEIKAMMNNMNYLVDIIKNNKNNTSRLVIKNSKPKEKTKQEVLFDLFPPIKEYIN